jgi:hypothetical protein
MFTKLIAVLIAAVMVFGGAAATASAAQNSLPVDALYPLKTLRESVELGLTVSPADKLEKALEHLQQRVDEMAALSKMGADIPEQLAEGYAEQVEYTLRLASKMSDAEMPQALDGIQVSLHEQLDVVTGLLAARPQDQEMAGVAEQLGRYAGLVELGLSQPQMFREGLAALLQGSEDPSSTQDPSVTEEPSVTETPEPGDDNSNDDNANDSNTNDDSVNGNDSNTNADDSNTNDDDSNSNDDDSNTNDDDSNTNDDDDSNINDDDDSNSNDDDSNTNDDDSNGNGDDDDSNGNGDDDDSNTNDDDSNSNDDDDDSNGNGDDDDSNSNDDDDNNSNDGTGSGTDDSNSSAGILGTFSALVTWIKAAVYSV